MNQEELELVTCPTEGCGASLIEQQCKRICPNCGYTESCEDVCLTAPKGGV